MKDLYNENDKPLKKSKKTTGGGKISHADGLIGSIL
jgi:hypothetical protein